jgi:hypothetical protein
MADDISVRITADIADLQEQFALAKSSVSDFSLELKELARQAQDGGINDIPGEANRAAETARRLADEIAQSDEQLALKRIAATQQANNFDLSMGQESVVLWKEYALEAADAKIDAETTYLQKKAAADKSNAVAEQRDQDQMKIANQEYLNQLTQINQQYTQKKRQQDQQALQDSIQADNTEYSDTVSKLNAEVADHQISASQRAQAEIALATTVERQELAMFDAAHVNAGGMVSLTEQETKQRQAIIDAFSKRVETADDQLTTEEAQKWTQLGNSIKSSFNSAIDSMLFQGKTFGQGMLTIAQGVIKAFLQMGENIAENWIETQIAALFTTKTTQATGALGQITDAAGVAAANTFASTSAIPVLGPELAPGAAAAAFADTMSWASALSFAVGAWEIPGDMRAVLHRGEMVVPQNFASGLRANGGGLGGGDVNMHYAPTINAREPATLSQMLARESGEMLSWLNRQFRNGALRTT